jgi:hypothetical protein
MEKKIMPVADPEKREIARQKLLYVQICRKCCGIMTLGEVVLLVNKDRPGKVIAAKDVITSIDKLVEAKLIPKTKELSSGVVIVEFIPANLSDDQEEVLALSSRKGWISLEELILKTRWSQERAERALESMRDSGIARVDASYAEGKKYYFPGLGGS